MKSGIVAAVVVFVVFMVYGLWPRSVDGNTHNPAGGGCYKCHSMCITIK